MRLGLIAAILLLGAAQGWAADTLLYDPGSDGYIDSVLTNLGITYDLRSSTVPVTAADLASHSLLIVGWNSGGDVSGLPSSVLASGITGRILLSGHDPDFHGYGGNQACLQFIVQSMAFARRGGGTGMVCFGDPSLSSTWLPVAWGITGLSYSSDNVTAITPAGVSSGVYNGLTVASMSNWGTAYHETFSAYGSTFKALELSDNGGAVTVATPEPATLTLIVLGGLGILARRRARARREA
jgi:hypothetical protein